MSTPESIVVSLEWAKKLKDAGWPQGNYAEDVRSHFYWYNTIDGLNNWKIISLEDIRGLISKFEIAAPTAEELLRRLPHRYIHGESFALFAAITNRGHPHGIGWYVGYRCFGENTWHPEIEGQVSDTLANAASAMYCHLAENNLLPKS